MDEMEKIELIDQYLRNELNLTEKANFERKVDSDLSFKQMVEDMKISQEVIRSYAIREEIKAIRKEMLQKNEENTTAASSSFKLYAFRIAASILLLMIVFGGYQFTSLTGDRLYAEKFEVYQTETTRGTQTQNNETEAFNEYQMENYSGYISSYEKFASPSLKATFLAGNSYLQLSDPEKAMAAFRDILDKNAQSNEKYFQEDAEYYLAMAMVKKGNYAQARSILENIAQNPDHKYQSMVGSLYLWKLKMMEWKES